MQTNESALSCDECGCDVTEKDLYCPQCGGIFHQPMFCATHPGTVAEGVCVICNRPFCGSCGSRVNYLSLCQLHEGYEIIEGKARVFGEPDNVQAQFVARCLEQAGLHPFLFSRSFNPGADIAPYFTWRQFGGHILGEIKVFVPFGEVLEAEKILEKLEFHDSEKS